MCQRGVVNCRQRPAVAKGYVLRPVRENRVRSYSVVALELTGMPPLARNDAGFAMAGVSFPALVGRCAALKACSNVQWAIDRSHRWIDGARSGSERQEDLTGRSS